MPAAPQTESDFVGIFLSTVLPMIIVILTGRQRVQAVLTLFQRVVKVVAVDKTGEGQHGNGHHTHQAMMLALSSEAERVTTIQKQLDDFREEVKQDLRDHAIQVRSSVDSLILGQSRFQREIRENLETTNKRVDALAKIVNSMNGNGKAHDEGGEA